MGNTGVELRLTAQSIKVWEPRIAKMIVAAESIGTDLINIAFVPERQSADMCMADSDEVAFGLV